MSDMGCVVDATERIALSGTAPVAGKEKLVASGQSNQKATHDAGGILGTGGGALAARGQDRSLGRADKAYLLNAPTISRPDPAVLFTIPKA